jgi:RHS repeat-associated protein
MHFLGIFILFISSPAFAAPDLIVTTVDAPSYASIGGNISVTVTFKNQGTNLTQGSYVRCRVIVSQDTQINLADSYYTELDIPNSELTAGASATRTFNYTLPSSLSGPYYVGAYVDSVSYHTESNENNNANYDSTPMYIGPPPTPSGLNLTQISGGFRIGWNTVSGTSGSTPYQIYWGNDSSVSESNYAGILNDTAPTYDHTGLVNGSSYYYRIRACNASGCSALSSVVSGTYLVAPSTPTGLSLAQITGGFRINWNTVTGAGGSTPYQIYWGNDSSVSESNYAGILNGSSPPYDHTGLTNGSTYYYRIRACNAGGCSTLSSLMSAFYDSNIAALPSFVPLYRMYKYDQGNNTRDHFYTISRTERDQAISSMGYKDEGVECYVSGRNYVGSLPLFRLYLDSQNSHYYTTSVSDRDAKIASQGYVFEKIEGYLSSSSGEGMVSLRRLKQPTGTEYHYFLSSKKAEYTTLIGSTYNYTDQGFIGYVQPYTARDATAHGRPQGIYSGTDLASGAFRISGGTYLVMRGHGPTLSFSFNYNSFDMNHYPHPMGPGWKHGLESRIDEDVEGNVFVTWQDGSVSYFQKSGSTYNDMAGNHDQLTLVNEGVNYGYDIKRKEQTVHRYRKYSVNPWPGTPSSEWSMQENYRILLLDITDWAGNKLTYNRNAAYGQIEWIGDNYGRKLVFTYTTPKLQLQRIEETVNESPVRWISFTYNPDNTLATFTDARGRVTSYTYTEDSLLGTMTDPEGNLISTVYDSEKKVNTVQKGNDPAATISYNPTANVTSVRDPRNNTSTWSHVGWKLTSQQGPDMNPASYEYNDSSNPYNPTRIVDRMGNATQFEYDGSGNATKITNALGKVANYSYNSKNKLISSADFHAVGASIPATIYSYDMDGNRVRSIQNPEGEITWLYYDASYADRITSSRDPRSNITYFEYDQFGNLYRTTDPEGNVTTYTNDYAGRVSQVTDAKSRSTGYSYNESDSISSILNALSHSVNLSYTGNNQLWTVNWSNDGTSSNTQYSYNSEDRLESVINPLNLYTSLTYDNSGNLYARQDYKNITTTYGYDVNDRVQNIYYPGFTSNIGRNLNGSITSITSQAGSTSFEYNELNLIKKYTDPYNHVVTYIYNDAGRLYSITYPGNRTVTYGYDNAGRMISISDWLGGTTTYTYDSAGSVSQIQRPNGTRATYSYDRANRLVSVAEQRSDNTVICSYSYVKDAVGNITSSSVTEPLTPSLTQGTINYTYDKRTNRILTSSGISYTHDDNGNRLTSTNAGGTTYTWNYENMLTQLSQTSPVNNIQHIYDGLNNRIAKIENGSTKRFVLDLIGDMSKVLAETDSSGAITAYYVYGTGLISRITAAGDRQYYHFNNRGDTIALTNQGGTVTDSYSYDDHGRLLSSTGSTTNPFKFVGQFGVMEEGNNLYFMRARFYDAETGRFLSEDPIGIDSGEFNSYSYAKSNSLSYIDPEGTITINPLNAFATAFIQSGYITWNYTQEVYYTIKQIGAYKKGNYDLSHVYGQMANESSSKVQSSFLAIVVSAFEPKIAGSKHATRVFGKTGYLKLIDMRTTKGIIIKVIWTVGEEKLKDEGRSWLIEKILKR